MMTTKLTAEHCAAKIMQVIPMVVRFLRAEMRRQGQPLLSLSQLRVLGFLQRHPQASLSEVADYLDVTRSTMSAMIERLVQRGLVDRTDDPQQRRRLILTLTATGAQHLRLVSDATRSKVAELLVNLSEVQLRQLMEGIVLVEEAFEET